MTKFNLKGNSQKEIEDKISKTVTLEKDEKILIKVIKEPKKFLFINFQGEYEVSIIKKGFENKKEVKKEIKKEVKKEVKKEPKKKVEEKKVKEVKPQVEDKVLSRLKVIVKELIAHSNLDIKIKNIDVKDNNYKVELDGSDVKYFIGDRGIAISSLEYIIMSFPEFKNVKVYFDSNNFKEKREKSLRDLANKSAKQVLKTNRKIKLNPMTSRERRIIHEEISKIEGLETISLGQEPKRHLVIKPKNNKTK